MYPYQSATAGQIDPIVMMSGIPFVVDYARRQQNGYPQQQTTGWVQGEIQPNALMAEKIPQTNADLPFYKLSEIMEGCQLDPETGEFKSGRPKQIYCHPELPFNGDPYAFYLMERKDPIKALLLRKQYPIFDEIVDLPQPEAVIKAQQEYIAKMAPQQQGQQQQGTDWSGLYSAIANKDGMALGNYVKEAYKMMTNEQYQQQVAQQAAVYPQAPVQGVPQQPVQQPQQGQPQAPQEPVMTLPMQDIAKNVGLVALGAGGLFVGKKLWDTFFGGGSSHPSNEDVAALASNFKTLLLR